ncbi:MAG: hypothetical protein NVS1B6_16300 [Steroidobacteraceae bacterium]
MLQVIDEIDDVIGALRLTSLGVGAELGLAAAGGLGIGAIGAAIATDAEFALIFTASTMLCLAAALKIRAQRQPGR